MKKIKLYAFVLVLSITGLSNAQLNAQYFQDLDKSPHDIVYFRTNKISQPIIKVLYGRPQKRGRKIFGELIPYDKIWRVGADEAFSTAMPFRPTACH